MMTLKNRSVIWAAFVLLTSVVLVSCTTSPKAAVPSSDGLATSAVECLVAYSSRAGTGIDEQRTVVLSTDARQEAIDLGDLTFHAQYWPRNDAPGEHTFRVWVTVSDTQAEIVAQLYQLPLTEAVRNQFVGDHGFTGLGYVYHPVSRAELQYTCKAQ